VEDNYNEPNIDRMREMINSAVIARAKLREAKLLLAMYQAEMDQRKARTPSVRMIGLDEESRTQLRILHWTVKECEDAVDAAEAAMEIETFVKELAKMRYYRERVF
jgi:hypothetical protein